MPQALSGCCRCEVLSAECDAEFFGSAKAPLYRKLPFHQSPNRHLLPFYHSPLGLAGTLPSRLIPSCVLIPDKLDGG
jgi:hypothetical protein